MFQIKKLREHLQIRASSSHFCRWQPRTSDKIEQLGPARVSRPPGSTRAAQTSDECSDLKRKIVLSKHKLFVMKMLWAKMLQYNTFVVKKFKGKKIHTIIN